MRSPLFIVFLIIFIHSTTCQHLSPHLIYTVRVLCIAIHWWRWLYSHQNIWITVKRGLLRIIGSWHLNTIHAHWCCVNCTINAVYMMVITPLPHTWLLCHLLVALYRRWFAPAPNTVLDLGLLVEYCAPHNFDRKWTCFEQCRMLHIHYMSVVS